MKNCINRRLVSPAAIGAALAIIIFLSSCATPPGPVDTPWNISVPTSAAPEKPGTLVDATFALTFSARAMSSRIKLLSSKVLGTQISTSFLASQNYDRWQASVPAHMKEVRAIAIKYRSQAVLGEFETQSGMIFLPESNPLGGRDLTWVVYTKGTELNRKEVPSRNAGLESQVAVLIASLGYAVWMPDYPGMGVAPGVQTYCDPGSLARSTLDGLAAARSWYSGTVGVGNSGSDNPVDKATVPASQAAYTESGRLYVVGFSEGGLTSMAVMRAIEEHESWSEVSPSAFPGGLSLAGGYPMSGPFNLTRGFSGEMVNGKPMGNPSYTLLMLAGFARAHPDHIELSAIVRDDIRDRIMPLLGETLGTEKTNRMIARMRNKRDADITAADILRPEYIEALKNGFEPLPSYRIFEMSRMDRWVPAADIPMTLAASRKDKVVSFENSAEAFGNFMAAQPGARIRLMELASSTHGQAGVEALLFAAMDIDRLERRILLAPSPK